jgi:cytochrome c oxidase assembly protein subunit 15
LNRFKKFAVFCLSYNVLVILWGAYVRASGSGAGCGSHWPLCNGEVIPRPERIQTWIELTHRLSSGLCLVFAMILMGWSWRLFPKKHPARSAANWTFGLTISEALVGAALVLLALVEHDQSVRRAVSISIHLVNTLFLLAALSLTVRYSFGYAAPLKRWQEKPKRWFITALVAMLLLGTTGALTALGDTLFQSTSLASGFAKDFASGSPFLVKLRVLHPAMAVVTAIVLYLFSEFSIRWAESSPAPAADTKRWARALQGLVLIQMVIGGTNLLLLAPIGLQMVHLLLADLVWISLVMLSAAVLTQSSSSVRM